MTDVKSDFQLFLMDSDRESMESNTKRNTSLTQPRSRSPIRNYHKIPDMNNLDSLQNSPIIDIMEGQQDIVPLDLLNEHDQVRLLSSSNDRNKEIGEENELLPSFSSSTPEAIFNFANSIVGAGKLITLWITKNGNK